MSTDKLITAIEAVRSAREALRVLGHKCASKEAQFTKARSAVALAESELREHGKRLGVCITVMQPEQHREPMVCARTLKGYASEE